MIITTLNNKNPYIPNSSISQIIIIIKLNKISVETHVQKTEDLSERQSKFTSSDNGISKINSDGLNLCFDMSALNSKYSTHSLSKREVQNVRKCEIYHKVCIQRHGPQTVPWSRICLLCDEGNQIHVHLTFSLCVRNHVCGIPKTTLNIESQNHFLFIVTFFYQHKQIQTDQNRVTEEKCQNSVEKYQRLMHFVIRKLEFHPSNRVFSFGS